VRGEILGRGADEDSFSIGVRGVQVDRVGSSVGSHDTSNAQGE
jgi:hypothetical protein